MQSILSAVGDTVGYNNNYDINLQFLIKERPSIFLCFKLLLYAKLLWKLFLCFPDTSLSMP